jgi:hypothetical protein
MRKKQPWMKKGNKVLALGKVGTITKMPTNTIDGTEYVYNIDVKLEGKKHSNPYHPNDISEFVETEVTNA